MVSCSFGKKIVKKVPGKGGVRWYKDVGLGFKTPREAIEGELALAQRSRPIEQLLFHVTAASAGSCALHRLAVQEL